MTHIRLLTLFAATTALVAACAASPNVAPTSAVSTANTGAAKPAAESVSTIKLAEAAPQTSSRPPIISQTLTQEERFRAWKQDFIRRATERGYDPEMVRALIMPAVINEKALDRDKTQPEFTKPIWSYVDNAANASRLNGGKAKLAKQRTTFDAVEGRYFVDRHVLTAIWGLESAYGKIQGTHDIISALSTFAFEGRRSKFGERELFGILDAVKAGYVRPDQLKGSWAGAMGMMQFIPTTFRDYAVDFDGNGNRDLWQSEPDALGSAAHYLSRHGWKWGEPVFAEVKLPSGFDYSTSDGRKMSINQWTALGVAPVTGQRWSQEAGFLETKLLVPAGHRGPKFLTFKNFDVIKKYNNSTSYALGIGVLAEALKGNASIRTPWPRDDDQLSLTDKKNLQRRLTALGYDTKGVDGQIGPNSRRAIRAWQAANSVVADGYVEQALFARIMGQ